MKHTLLLFSLCSTTFGTFSTHAMLSTSGVPGGAPSPLRISTEDELLTAINNDEIERTRLLINTGANVNARFKDGSTPLMQAAARNNIAIVQLLLENGALVNKSDEKGQTVREWVGAGPHNAEIKELLKKYGAR